MHLAKDQVDLLERGDPTHQGKSRLDILKLKTSLAEISPLFTEGILKNH